MHWHRVVSLAALSLTACVHRQALLAPTERAGAVVKYKVGDEVPPILREEARPVTPEDRSLPQLIESMRLEFEKTGGVGLAAPQVGVSRRVVLIKLNTRPKGDTRVEAFVNPVIDEHGPETELDWEACLSVEDVGGQVRRFKRVILSYDPVGGGPRLRARLADWDARIAQHELDHLDGRLFVDQVEGPLVSIEEMRKRRDDLHRKRGWIPPEPPAAVDAPPPPAP